MTSADLIHPTGELSALMFPGEDMTTIVTQWLNDAVARTSTIVDLTQQADAQRAWVYYRGYTALANRLAATPNSESSFGGEAQRGWSESRPTHWRKLAEERLTTFQALTAAPAVTVENFATTVSVKAIARW